MTLETLDARLVRDAQGGGAEAFATLVERHQQALRAFLRRTCGDWALADDLAQEALLTAWSRIDRLDPQANVRAWFCGIGYNKYMTWLRSQKRTRQREADYQAGLDPSSGLAVAEHLALEQAMNALPLEQRAVVALCLAAEFSHAEAAVILKMPLGTVKSHVARGRARLVEVLRGNNDGR